VARKKEKGHKKKVDKKREKNTAKGFGDKKEKSREAKETRRENAPVASGPETKH